MKKIVTIVGARPQFIKAAPVSKVLRRYFNEVFVHTGQHYDSNMSDVFFKQLNIPEPNINLEVGSGRHGQQTASMITKIEEFIIDQAPALVIIYGDTNSTLAASVAAAKLHVPVAHIEAGLRNFDLSIPEEVNRVVADKLSKYLFAPTTTAVDNLKAEGITQNVFLTGDVMIDVLLYGLELAKKHSAILEELNLERQGFCLTTIHRAENTNNVENLKQIIKALGQIKETIVFPAHPRTKNVLENNSIRVPSNILMIPSVGYLDFITLESNARLIITDSGGVQKEAYFLKVPCITIFPSTSWVETVDDGWNKLADANYESILNAYHTGFDFNNHQNHYGDGKAAEKIVSIINNII